MLATTRPAQTSGTAVPLEMRTQQNQYLRGIDNAEITQAVHCGLTRRSARLATLRPNAEPAVCCTALTPRGREVSAASGGAARRSRPTDLRVLAASDRSVCLCRRSTVPDPQR
jgi:hypothetical protein